MLEEKADGYPVGMICVIQTAARPGYDEKADGHLVRILSPATRRDAQAIRVKENGESERELLNYFGQEVEPLRYHWFKDADSDEVWTTADKKAFIQQFVTLSFPFQELRPASQEEIDAYVAAYPE